MRAFNTAVNLTAVQQRDSCSTNIQRTQRNQRKDRKWPTHALVFLHASNANAYQSKAAQSRRLTNLRPISSQTQHLQRKAVRVSMGRAHRFGAWVDGMHETHGTHHLRIVSTIPLPLFHSRIVVAVLPLSFPLSIKYRQRQIFDVPIRTKRKTFLKISYKNY